MLSTLFPVNNELALSNLIADPIETHIHSLGMFLVDGVISNTTGSAIIGDNGSRRLRMTEFSQDVANSISLLATVKRAASLALAALDSTSLRIWQCTESAPLRGGIRVVEQGKDMGLQLRK